MGLHPKSMGIKLAVSFLGPTVYLFERSGLSKYGFMESLRKRFSGGLFGRAGPRQIRESEHVTDLDVDLGELEKHLRDQGFVRNLLSRVKMHSDKPESGSWVLRDSLFDERQLHIMLFQEENQVKVFAHEEYSSINPHVAPRHYFGESQNVDRGLKKAENYLP